MTATTWTAKQVTLRTACTWSLALLSMNAHAATHRVPGEFETLGAVFAQIASGDTILVAPGTYGGPGNRGILVRTTDFVLISEKGAAETVLDLDRERGAYLLQLELQTRATLIEGFTLQRSEGASALVIRSSGPVIRNCVFRDNRGGNSGGLLTQGTSPALIENCLFENNTGTWGGGAGCDGTAQAEFVSCRFFENGAIEGGGLGFSGAWGDATVRIEDCIFGRNSADRGGAISIFPNTADLELVVDGCTISENSASDQGGGFWCSGSGQTTIVIERSILSGNSGPRGPDLLTRCDPPVIRCSAVHPDSIFGDVVYGDDNVSQDPLLCLAGDLENRYRLDEGSPCLPEFSPCGERIGALGVGCVDGVGGACCLDDGTCEVTTLEMCAGTYQGDSAPCDPGSCREGGACCVGGICSNVTREHCAQLHGIFLGNSVECPPSGCPTVACCLDDGACVLLDAEACVAAGGSCLHPDVGCDPNPCGPRILRVPSEHPTIASALEAACRGDTVLLAPGTYTGSGNRDLRVDVPGLTLKSEEGAESTILDCRGIGRAFVVGGGTDSNVRIEGITIRDGRAIESNGDIGGGILFEMGTHSLVDCRVEGCSAPVGDGGGIACLDAEVSIIECAIIENSADDEYGAAHGGGVYAHQSVVTIESSVVAGNECGRGSGVYVERGELAIRNSSITGNWAGHSGGGIEIDRSAAVIEGCTIGGNRGWDVGGGLFVYKSQGVEIRRTILWGNLSRRASEAFFSSSESENRVSLSVLNVPRIEADRLVLEDDAYFQDPLFCAPVSPLEAPTTAGDYSVADNSICVSTNNPSGERIGAIEPGCSPLAIGACCNGKDAVCILASPTACADFGWVFWGEDVPCDPVPCEEPGACCFNDGGCTLLVEEICLAREGRHHGEGTPCSPDLCPAPQPCCIPDRSCALLPPVVCEESGGMVLDPGPCNEWTCTPNRDGRLLVHASAFSDTLPDRCAEIRNSVPGNGVHTVTVLAAFPPENSPRLRKVGFGIDYPSDAFQILSWDAVSGTATPSQSWPAPGSEIVIEWEEARPNAFEPLVSFEISISAPFAELRTTKSSQEPFGFVDDFDPPNDEEIACFGSLGIGGQGNQCCWTVGACCEEENCIETTENHCGALEWFYGGDDTECYCYYPAVLLNGVTVRERDFQVELAWEASSDVGIRGFRVLRGDHPEESASALPGLPEVLDGSWRYLDTTPAPGRSYSYWIESIEIDGSLERFGPWEIEIPEAREPRLLRIRPNPTTRAAEIDLFLPADLECSLTICDASGRAVRILDLDWMQAGHNTELWDGKDALGRPVEAGIYFLRLRAGRWRLAGKVVVIG